MATLGKEDKGPLRILSISLKFQKQKTRTYTLELSCREESEGSRTQSKLKVDQPKFSADARRRMELRLTPPCSLLTNQGLVVHVKKKLFFFRTHLVAETTFSHNEILRHLEETAAHGERPLYRNDKIEIYLTGSTDMRSKETAKAKKREVQPASAPSPGPSSAPIPGSASLPTRESLPALTPVHAPAAASILAPVPTVSAPAPAPAAPLSLSPSPYSVNLNSSKRKDTSSSADEKKDDTRNTQDNEFINDALSYILDGRSDSNDASSAPRGDIAALALDTNSSLAEQKQASTNHALDGVSAMRTLPPSSDFLRSTNESPILNTDVPGRLVAPGSGAENTQPRADAGEGADLSSNGVQSPSNSLRSNRGPQPSSNNAQPGISPPSQGPQRPSNNSQPDMGVQHPSNVQRPTNGGSQPEIRSSDLNQPPSRESQRPGVNFHSTSGRGPQPNFREDKRSTSNQQYGVESVNVTAQPADSRPERGQLQQRSSGDSKDTGVIEQPVSGSAPPGEPQHSSQPVRKGTQPSSKEKDAPSSDIQRPYEEQPHSALESGVNSQFVRQTHPPKTEDTSRTGKDSSHSQGIKGGVGSVDKKQSNQQASVGNRPDQSVDSSIRSGPRSTESDNRLSPSAASDVVNSTRPGNSSQQGRPGHPSQVTSKNPEPKASKRNTA